MPKCKDPAFDAIWCALLKGAVAQHRTNSTHLSLWQCLDILLCLLAVDKGQVAVRGRPQCLDDQLELIYVVLARKQGLALQQFC